ncbi:MAG: 2-isopropylmalate synthase [Synergistales bacterium]|nr:2-isopropylmalate synthase [Synergistales bacterium]
MNEDNVRIFDTTLRDGEQAARINLNTAEKVQIAKQLEKLRVDIIEAGFPAASPGDMEAVRAIAGSLRYPVIAGLARCSISDIEAAALALEGAEKPRIHTFIATSDIHLQDKLRMTRPEVLEKISKCVSHARSLVDDVEFSAEDASRSDTAFLIEAFQAAVDAGATTLNIPDTVGYAVPHEFKDMVEKIMAGVRTPREVVWSVHAHNDLGLAVINSLEAVRSGIRQVECTINGLGERAGNASLEEVVMGLRTRKDYFGVETRIDTTRLFPTSSMVSKLTGFPVPPNKAIVGSNAFAHEAGIHQHGILCNRATYEIMNAEDVGAPSSSLILGKHSGKHAFRKKVEDLNYSISEEEINKAFSLFKELCDRKEYVSTEDIEILIIDEILAVSAEREYILADFNVHTTRGQASAAVSLKNGDTTLEDAATGNGPVDAAYAAIRRIIGLDPQLVSYKIDAASERSDAIGEAHVSLELKGLRSHGRGASTDIVEASIKAYINAVNRICQLAEVKGIALQQ